MHQGCSFGAAFETASDAVRPQRSPVQRMKRSASSSGSERDGNDAPQAKCARRARRVHWADELNGGADDRLPTETAPKPPCSGLESAMFFTSITKQNDTLVRPTPTMRRQNTASSADANLASAGAAIAAMSDNTLTSRDVLSLSAHVGNVMAAFKKAAADYEKAKTELRSASTERAPDSILVRLEKRASVLDAIYRREFENAFLLAVQIKIWPYFLAERVGMLAAVIRYNRDINPGELGVSPAFALHALRCANWTVLKNAHGTASILPTGVIPGLQVALW